MAEAHSFDAEEEALREMSAGRVVVGSQARVHAELTAIAEECEADEIMLLTHAHDHEARWRSYALISEAFGSA